MQSRRTSLTDDVAALAGPIDDELNAYLKAHADTFRVQRQFTFSHIYLNPERRGVAEYVPDFATYYRKPDLTVSLDGATFAKLYLNTIDLAVAVSSGSAKVTEGKPAEVAALLEPGATSRAVGSPGNIAGAVGYDDARCF